MERRLEDRVAIVTGAAQGIGKGVAIRLAREGCHVAVVDIDEEKADQTAREIVDLGRRAMACRVDLATADEIRAMVEKVEGEFGGIDILVNNAGVALTKPLLETTEEDWDRVTGVNVKGTFFCIQAVGERMIGRVPEDVKAAGRSEKSYGKIVNLSSISGRRGRALQVVYGGTKAAIIHMTQSAALAFAPYNINVNAIAPSVVPTAMWEEVDRARSRLAGEKPGAAMKEFTERIPLKRLGMPEDMAGAAAFLCSSDADYITGQTLNVDGGFEMN